MKTKRIKPNELLETLSTIIKDEIIATQSIDDNSLSIRFLNGQKFQISITEIIA